MLTDRIRRRSSPKQGVSMNSQGRTVAIEPALLTRAEAAKFLALSPRSLDELSRRGDLHPIRIPGLRRVAFSVEDLRQLVRAWRSDATCHVDSPSFLGNSSQP